MPFSEEMTRNSTDNVPSFLHRRGRALWPTARSSSAGGNSSLVGARHLASGRLGGGSGVENGIGPPAVAGLLLVILDVLAIRLHPGRDHEGLLRLVIGGTHLHDAVQALDLHAFERLGDLDRI